MDMEVLTCADITQSASFFSCFSKYTSPLIVPPFFCLYRCLHKFSGFAIFPLNSCRYSLGNKILPALVQGPRKLEGKFASLFFDLKDLPPWGTVGGCLGLRPEVQVCLAFCSGRIFWEMPSEVPFFGGAPPPALLWVDGGTPSQSVCVARTPVFFFVSGALRIASRAIRIPAPPPPVTRHGGGGQPAGVLVHRPGGHGHGAPSARRAAGPAEGRRAGAAQATPPVALPRLGGEGGF